MVPVAATGQSLGLCVLKCLYTEEKEVKLSLPIIEGRDEFPENPP